MKNKIFLSIFISLFSSAALAGIRVGNGGNVIVCADSTFSLDLYEGEVQSSLHYQKESRPWKDIIHSKIQKLTGLEIPSKEVFQQWLAQFDQDVNFVSADLGPIDDSNHAVQPKNCQVVQAANQQFHPLPGEKRYILSEKLWSQLADWDRAALVMHEFAYRYLQQETSVNARAFTALMFSVEVESLSKGELQARMKEFGF